MLKLIRLIKSTALHTKVSMELFPFLFFCFLPEILMGLIWISSKQL
jgi:hypothetical protein